MAINGAYDWLRSGRVPEYHLIIDPQPFVAGLFLRHPHRLTEYLIADTVHPSTLDALEGFRPTLCRFTDDGVPGGCSAMTRAPMLAAILGYRRIDLFGADCCWPEGPEGRTHVYDHPRRKHVCRIECDGRLWWAPLDLLRQAAFMAEAFPVMCRAGLDIRVRGDDHLTAAMLRTGGEWRDTLETEAA